MGDLVGLTTVGRLPVPRTSILFLQSSKARGVITRALLIQKDFAQFPRKVSFIGISKLEGVGALPAGSEGADSVASGSRRGFRQQQEASSREGEQGRET